MSSPIFQCQEGHIFCNGCQPKLSKCPVCGYGEITNINLIAQKILGTQSHSAPIILAPAQRSPTRNNEGSNNLIPNQPFEGDEYGFGDVLMYCFIYVVFFFCLYFYKFFY